MSNSQKSYKLIKDFYGSKIDAYIVEFPHVSKRFDVTDNVHATRADALRWARAVHAQETQETQETPHGRLNVKTKIITKPTATKPTATKKPVKRPSGVYVEYPTFYLVFTALNGSSNRKTGDMIQTYLLDKSRLKSEKSVFGAKCQDCSMVKECYVSRDKLSVRRSLVLTLEGQRATYQKRLLGGVLPLLKGRLIRLGTYGDPSAIPLRDLARICSSAKGHTGYTHFWREIDEGYSAYLMSSCETLADELLSNALGYRAFRVLLDAHEVHETSKKSVQCLNASVGLTCAECLLCSGSQGKGSSNIYIHQH